MRSIVITGVSSGIGYGVAKEFARRRYRVFGSVRREVDAERLGAELGANFRPLRFDVTDREAVLAAVKEVGGALNGEGLAGLVNNAGTAIAGPLMHQPLEQVRTQFEINVLGLVSTTQAFLPLLGAAERRTHPPGRILNISSVGGRIASPFLGAYVGTKHAVEGISDSLRRELLPYGIDVIVVRPGIVRTEIWEKGAAPARSAYTATIYEEPLASFEEYVFGRVKSGYSPEEFGVRIRRVFEARRPRTRYAIVRRRFSNWTVPTSLPDRWLDRIIGKEVGLTQEHRSSRVAP